jgi:outer membrane protein OmpA-like peptidoglycan-associated protein
MKRKFTYKILLFCLIVLTIPALSLYAQVSTSSTSLQKKLLVRDSLDYKNIPILINTTSNEFSPLPYKGGLMYISNKPIPKEKVVFNKIYWTKDTGFKIIDKININFNSIDTTIKYIKEGKTDDFTAPTSNDNDILVRYKKNNRSENSIEISFSNFSTDQSFSYNDSSKLLIYAKKSNYTKDGVKHWALWQAYLLNGKLKQKKKILFEDSNADYLYPFLTEDGSKLYLSSNSKNGKGGYDIYHVNIQGGVINTNLIALNDINTKFDEIGPSVINDTIFFSSNKEGGLGGFDAYNFSTNSKWGVRNIGYPVNSEKDEVGIKKAFDTYYLTTNRNGNFDILNLKYLPISYVINGVLTYRNDGSLASNHLMYLKDKDAGVILDSIRTDNYAKYSFIGKPNRDYEFTTLNGDSLYEQFAIQISPNQKQLDFISYINGRTPKQKADSLNALWVMEENRKADSIAKFSVNTKFVVHYGFDKSNISNSEKLVLDSLIKKLTFLPKVFISVGAFTDCIGSYKYNYRLSVKRGKAVVSYLIKNGLDKQRIIANGYSKKYTISPCLTKYSNKTKSLQQDSRRAEIVLSENKKTDWATLELQRGKNYYTIYNSSKVVSSLIVNAKINKDSIKAVQAYLSKQALEQKLESQRLAKAESKLASETKAKEKAISLANEMILKDSIKVVQAYLAKQKLEQKLQTQRMAKAEGKLAAESKAKEKAIALANEMRLKDSINKANAIAALNLKNENLLKVKLELGKQDSIKSVQLFLVKQALAQKLEAQKQLQAASKLAAETKAKEKAIALANEMRLKDSINKANAIAALNLKNENLLKVKLELAKQDSIESVQLSLVKQALAQKLETQKQLKAEAKLLAETKAKEKAIAMVNELRIKDSINKANAITTLNLRNENLLKAKLSRAKQDSTVKAKAKAELDFIAQVTAYKKRAKDSLAAASLKALTAKPNVIIAKSDIVSTPKVAVEEDITKEEILKSLDILAKLKLEQERIVEYLTKRINKKPILIYVSSDSVSIEIYDNGIHDNDSVSVIYNKRIVVDKQELKVNKPIKFKLKVDKDSKNNELVFVADNLGTEPPNTGVMFITEKSGRRQQIILSTDMTHNEVIYFIRIEKQ